MKLSVTIQKKTTEQYFPVVLFIISIYNFWISGWNHSVTIQMKATEQYFPVVLFIVLYKAVLTFGSVDEILKSDHTNFKV